ncbi:hypothetical protein MMC11_000315 [Xylographa trunciseda]|nr:hypothetical protein [Xylographa trunciseda]
MSTPDTLAGSAPDDSRVPLLLGFAIALILLSVLAVFACLNCGFVIWGTEYGLGEHTQNVPESDLTMINIVQLVTFMWYCTATSFLKISALVFYARIFSISRRFRIVLWITGAAVTIFWILLLVLPFTHCNPPLKAFYPLLKGTCWSGGTPWYLGSCITNVLLDLIVLVLPMPMVWDLQLKLGRKMQLSLIFLIGYSSALVGLARFAIVAHDPAILNDETDKDLTYNLVPMLLLSIMEPPLGIVALCGPSIRQQFIRGSSHGFKSLWSTRGSHRPLIDRSSYAAGTGPGSAHAGAGSGKRSGTSFPKLFGARHKSGTSSMSSSTMKTHGGGEDEMPSSMEIPMNRMLVGGGNQV